MFVILAGQTLLPLTASHDPSAQVSLPSGVLSSEEVYWEAGDDGPQNVSLSLPLVRTSRFQSCL